MPKACPYKSKQSHQKQQNAMLKKTFFAIAALIGCATSAKADGIWIDGFVYCDTSDSTQVVVPFANVAIYDRDNHEEQRYFTLANHLGYYEVQPYDHTKSYYMEISAPGYETRKTHIKPLPDSWKYNLTTDICLKSAGTAPAIPSVTFKADSLAKGATTVKDLILATIPSIHMEGDDWVTANDGSVIIFINDVGFKPQIIPLLGQIPAEAVDQIDLFTLPENSVYECAVRVNIPQLGQLNFAGRKYKDGSMLE